MRKILCVEDSPEMRILVEASLTGYEVVFAETLKEAKDIFPKSIFDLVILDLSLPDGEGFKFLTETTSQTEVPVFILTSRSDITQKIMAFSVGAEDFITKPFEPLELRARIDSKLKKREKAQEKSEVMRIGDIQINIPKQKLFLVHPTGSLEELHTTSLEFKLFLTLARRPEHIYSRETLLDDVWGHSVSVTDRTVDTHIGHLRKKLGASRTKIDTVVGAGYRLIIVD